MDNGSGDGTAAAVAGESPQVRVIANPQNVGFAAANNQAMRQRGAAAFCCSTAMPFRRPGGGQERFWSIWVSTWRWEWWPAAGEFGRFGAGFLLSVSHAASGVWLELLWVPKLLPPGGRWGDYRRWPHDAGCTVPWLIGACMLVRREVYERLGGCDERFFMYAEETDWQVRMRDAGWEIAFIPTAQVRHLGGASGVDEKPRINRHFFQSLDYYERKHHGIGGLIVLRVAMVVGRLLRGFRVGSLADCTQTPAGCRRQIEAVELAVGTPGHGLERGRPQTPGERSDGWKVFRMILASPPRRRQRPVKVHSPVLPKPRLAAGVISALGLGFAGAAIGLVALYVSVPAAGIVYAVAYMILTWVRPDLALMLMFAAAPFPYDLGGGSVKMALAEIDLVLAVLKPSGRDPASPEIRIQSDQVAGPGIISSFASSRSPHGGLNADGVKSMGANGNLHDLAVFVFFLCQRLRFTRAVRAAAVRGDPGHGRHNHPPGIPARHSQEQYRNEPVLRRDRVWRVVVCRTGPAAPVAACDTGVHLAWRPGILEPRAWVAAAFGLGVVAAMRVLQFRLLIRRDGRFRRW